MNTTTEQFIKRIQKSHEQYEKKRKSTKKPLTQLQQKAYEKIAERIKKGNDGDPTNGILMREVGALYDKGWIDTCPLKLL